MSSAHTPSSSHQYPQSSPWVDPPPAFELASPAIPPDYETDWAVAKRDKKIPHIIRCDKKTFGRYLRAPLLTEPWWFMEVERRLRPSDDLWANSIRLSSYGDWRSRHWSLRLLRYHIHGYQGLQPSKFAARILFEVVFVAFTGYPQDWDDGLRTLRELTNWSEMDILGWFKRRRNEENTITEDLEWSHWTQTMLYKYTTNSVSGRMRIRRVALAYLTDQGRLERLAQPRTFQSWIMYDLHGITEYKNLNSRTVFLHPTSYGIPSAGPSPSTTHSICVGPYRWSDNPHEDLQDIGTLRRWKSYWHLGKPRFPGPLSTRFSPYNREYRVFVFGSPQEAARYLNVWQSTTATSSNYHSVSASSYNPSLHD